MQSTKFTATMIHNEVSTLDYDFKLKLWFKYTPEIEDKLNKLSHRCLEAQEKGCHILHKVFFDENDEVHDLDKLSFRVGQSIACQNVHKKLCNQDENSFIIVDCGFDWDVEEEGEKLDCFELECKYIE
jgi:hypothetical protein